ncbi:helix-turn-helix domain-containing protein [Lignipirellula cremea]|uniref:Uncharacterized protein n=1 Tax=Lignipirellula cremea TaxID=2528010 RepID=A0A518DQM7_9BACT|nr:hypothetical protein [Lignipirellula cremea]QDU94129.1 hypothetical protein Pla8534_19150 [Lignipirellula cremea]
MNRVRLKPGDRTLSRRILKRCRDAGIDVPKDTSWGRFGRILEAYLVPRDIHDEEVARLEEERRVVREAAERRATERKAAIRRRQIEKLTQKFPQLALRTVKKLVDSDKVVYSADSVGYQHGVGTKTYWSQLGFKVTGKPTGILVEGKQLFDTFGKKQLVPKKSRLTVKSLKTKWTEKYGSETLVLAQAVRFGNRLQKANRIADFYDLKDRWIEENQCNLVEGRVTRVETKYCWGCDGTGRYGFYGRDCERCDGSGVYSQRTLYEHTFEIEGQRFVFHSYVRPTIVTDESAADLTAYGRPFQPDELPCPPQTVIVALIREMLNQADDENELPRCCFVAASPKRPTSTFVGVVA